MPPTRSMPPAKAIKTERTHEENQERAYIAASRRSDRSLEARVESARRASETHKRRTGRSLRVTEQDVINEEMYEEEDDDLPPQSRRLNAYLSNAYPPNNKLAAYLATNITMRNIVQQAVHDSYNQQYGMPSGGQQFGRPSMFPAPMAGPQTLPVRHSQSSSTYRQAPYSSPRPPSSQSGHSRSASIATPQNLAGNLPISPVVQIDDRRKSLPAVQPISSSSIDPQTPASDLSSKSSRRPSFPTGSFSKPQIPQQAQPSMPTYDALASGNGQSYGAFTTALPSDTQMFLRPSFGMNGYNDTSMPTGNNPNDNWNPDTLMSSSTMGEKQRQNYPTFAGLNATLAPSALDLNKPSALDTNSRSGQYFNSDSFDDPDMASFFGEASTGTNIDEYGTENWDSFISWDVPASQQSQ